MNHINDSNLYKLKKMQPSCEKSDYVMFQLLSYDLYRFEKI